MTQDSQLQLIPRAAELDRVAAWILQHDAPDFGGLRQRVLVHTWLASGKAFLNGFERAIGSHPGVDANGKVVDVGHALAHRHKALTDAQVVPRRPRGGGAVKE